MLLLSCPVRGCGCRLARGSREIRCPRGHSFDLAREGYCNLLQPGDRRSRNAGDPDALVEARKQWLERGLAAPLGEVLSELIDPLPLPERPAVLDAGCGDGYFLSWLAEARNWDACGIDLSSKAIRIAAARLPEATWLVANADRRLPFEDSSLDLILSIFGRRNGPEFHRVLRPEGHLVVTVPGEDDLIELRAAVLGRGLRIDRVGSTVASLEPFFSLVEHRTSRRVLSMDDHALLHLLSMTYRGTRSRERERAAKLTRLDVTLASDLLLFRPAASPVTRTGTRPPPRGRPSRR